MKFPMAQTWNVALYGAAFLSAVMWVIGTVLEGFQGNLVQVLINLFLSSFQVLIGTLILIIPVWAIVAFIVLVGRVARVIEEG